MALPRSCSLRCLISLAVAVALTVSLAPTQVAARRSLLTDDEHDRKHNREPLVRDISEFCGAQRECHLSHWKGLVDSHFSGTSLVLCALNDVSVVICYGPQGNDTSE
jgi:hypothetical protein